MRTKDFNVQYGDIWAFGPHRLLCADSTEEIIMDEFLKNYNPKVCVTDPPYGINYTSRANASALWQLKIKNDHIVNWSDALKNAKASALYVWYSFNNLEIVAKGIREAGYNAKQTIIWVKNHFSLQRYLYHSQHEQCLVCVKPRSMKDKFWTGDRKQTSVWMVHSVKKGERIHPTQKPVDVYIIPIKNHTNEGEYAIDLFAGSGTIFEACDKIKRVGLGVELCSDNCNSILNRMKKIGFKVTLERNLFLQQRTQHGNKESMHCLQCGVKAQSVS